MVAAGARPPVQGTGRSLEGAADENSAKYSKCGTAGWRLPQAALGDALREPHVTIHDRPPLVDLTNAAAPTENGATKGSPQLFCDDAQSTGLGNVGGMTYSEDEEEEDGHIALGV